jgi:tRNA pseudouridine55 synthase
MSRTDQPNLNGLLVIDKPAGITSHDVVNRVRRFVGMKRVGHGGTLDPFATGVLVVGVGRSTRVLQLVQESDKAYRAVIGLGATTDSADVDGTLISRTEPTAWPTREMVEQVVRRFMGTADQIPPAFSAIKVGGRRLYQLARAGVATNAPRRSVTIHAIEIHRFEPPWLEIGVRCGKGTYIRSLARDIGEVLGTGAYCHALQRSQNGPFCLGDAWSLDQLEALDPRAVWPVISLHPDAALQSLPAVILSEAQTASWYHGRSVPLRREADTEQQIRAYSTDGRFVGVGLLSAGALRSSLVFPPVDEDIERDQPAAWRDQESAGSGAGAARGHDRQL